MVVVNVVLHGVDATSLTGMSAHTMLRSKNHMYEHSQLLLSLTSDSDPAKANHQYLHTHTHVLPSASVFINIYARAKHYPNTCNRRCYDNALNGDDDTG